MSKQTDKGNHFGFTVARLERLEAPDTNRDWYHDTGCPGLSLCVTAGGSKVFYLYRRWAGQPLQYRIDNFPALNVEDARKQARALMAQQAAGVDIRETRKARREAPTLADLWAWWAEHSKQRKRSWKEDERQYNAFLKTWASRRLSAIHKPDVAAWHSKIGRENGPYAANRALALLSSMFGKADNVGYTGGNPCEGVAKFGEEKRDRFLSGEELSRFFSALGEEPEHFRDFFLICLTTGARRSNVQSLAWADVNLDVGLWKIPAAQAKAGETIVVPLVPAAVEILRRRRETSEGTLWVFPSTARKKSRSGHFEEPKFIWRRIVKRAGLADVRLHDLRRTLGSWMTMGGAGLPIVGKMLGHRQLSTTEIYARLQVDPIRASAESATTAMLSYQKPNGPTIDVESTPVDDDDQDEPTEF
jgi:integrase